MNKKALLLITFALLVAVSCKKSEGEVTSHTDKNGYSYETVNDDPTGLRLYTLDNGLKVYLSKNTDEPKIQTFIAVRAGSVYDPADNTGLAHYLEHMVFKGTDKIGTQDWEAEKPLLDMISDLYEQHKAETDPEKKKSLYRTIDSVSQEASKISIANEYDKMVSSLGAQGTNAWTWHEETVYTNKIPSNELDKWLALESERFGKLVLRLFHTELEAVYEEFNRSQDNDFRKEYFEMSDAMFPNHPYGQQPTIGVSEHLKNPSMIAIHDYFDNYYVPNNMAVVLVGDIDFEETIKKVDATFGKFENKELTHPTRPTEQPITSPVTREVYGPEAERVSIGFRTDGVGSEDERFVTLVDLILSNGTAGLIDLNLNQKQMVQRASSSTTFMNDYGMHRFMGYPRGGQSLDEVKDLLMEQLQNVKDGNFDEWMIEAVVNDLKLYEINQYENASSLANAYVNAFTQFQDWNDRVKFISSLKDISKEELVDFANKFYGDNYVVVYKKQGESTGVVKVENPGITPVQLNRDKKSTFLEEFEKLESPDIQPQFVDYKATIKETKLTNGIEVSYIPNDKNDLMQTYFIFDMGKDNDKLLDLAIGYLTYLGTDTYSPEDLKKEFYKIGIRYGVSNGSDRSYVYLSGLKENLPKGIELMSHLWQNAVADQEAYGKYIEKIQKDRMDMKANKGQIMFNGLMSYAQFGPESRLRNIYTLDELREINPDVLVEAIKDMKNYKHRIFYYGKDVDAAVAAINDKHQVPAELKDYPEAKQYTEVTTGDNVYFVNYDMVQAEMMFLSKGDTFSPEKMASARLFNSYFGSGLSSIVFQEIRESKSLAYSAYSAYRTASEAGKPDYVQAYIGTQANKIPQAVEAMMELMTNMPQAEEQFNSAKEATLKQLAAERITKTNIFWSYERLKKQGIDYDIREEMYNSIQKMTLQDLNDFFNENIKGGSYNVMVIGNKNDVDLNTLGKLGKLQELDVDYLFNFEQENQIEKQVKD
ncbi:MAG TPA: insulinase family protein [Flavobacteriaceae bacterium]|nr:insulinase family protein [Flavobacteriaceae bacterium]